MIVRKPLILAMAAAGLLAGEGPRDAQSNDVFVPELAMLDGTLCTAAMPQAGRQFLLQLAQATHVVLAVLDPSDMPSMNDSRFLSGRAISILSR